MNLDPLILTLIIAAPLAGAVVLALLPEREGSKLHAIGALIVTLITLGCSRCICPRTSTTTLDSVTRFQFRDRPPLDRLPRHPLSPRRRWPQHVAGRSRRLAGAHRRHRQLERAIKTRSKLFYTLFLLQQVAMLGIFVALDLFLYYGFWELSLVPMTLLIAVFGRTENRRKRRDQVLPLRLHPLRDPAGRHPLAL